MLKNGDGPDLPSPFFTAVKESDELAGSGGGGVPRRNRWTELLLLKCWMSLRSSGRFLKKVPFDAVMGVVGVLAICLEGGGERFLSE